MESPRISRRGRINEGRKPKTPTKKQRLQVQALAAVGTTHDAIAQFIGWSRHTIEKHFGMELATGRAQIIAMVGAGLVAKAISGNMTASIFFLKTQAGWRETSRTEITGADGKDLLHELTDEQMAERVNELMKQAREIEAGGLPRSHGLSPMLSDP